MSIENEIKKLTAAITELTAVLSTQETNHGTTEPTNVPEVSTPAVPAPAPPAPVAPAPSSSAPPAPQAVPPVPTAPTNPTPAPASEVPVTSSPAPAVSPAAQATGGTEQPTIDTVNAALVDKAGQMGDGGAAIFKMLRELFGVTGLSQIPAERLAEVLTAVEGLG